jgi:hypothetical protein
LAEGKLVYFRLDNEIIFLRMFVAFLSLKAVLDCLTDLLLVKTSTKVHFFEDKVFPFLFCEWLQESRYRNPQDTLACVKSIEQSMLVVVVFSQQ